MLGVLMIAGVAYGVVTIGRTGPYLAWLVARHGRQTRALEALVRANPADATAHRDLAQLWLVRRRPRRALDHAERALAREPDDIELRYLIAQCRLALGEHAVAAEALQAIAARDPRFRYGEPTLRAADALYALGPRAGWQVRRLRVRMRSGCASSRGPIDRKGTWKRTLHRFWADAEAALRRFAERNQSSVEARVKLARCLTERGDRAGARAMTAEARSIYRELPRFQQRAQRGWYVRALIAI